MVLNPQRVFRMLLNSRGSYVLLLLATACARSYLLAPANDDVWRLLGRARLASGAPRPVRGTGLDHHHQPDVPLLKDVRLGYIGADSTMGAARSEPRIPSGFPVSVPSRLATIEGPASIHVAEPFEVRAARGDSRSFRTSYSKERCAE